MSTKRIQDIPILVNGENQLASDVIPADLVPAPFSQRSERLTATTAEQLKKLIYSIGGEKEILVTSGYRSFLDQEKLYNQSLILHGKAYTEKYVAKPGSSEHQTGLAVDLGLKGSINNEICPCFEEQEITRLFLKRIADFGFILRYPKGKTHLTGIAYEPWHFRYVGMPHSWIIDQRNWTLEEYHQFLNQRSDEDE